MTTADQLPRIRFVGVRRESDAAWADLLEAARFWRSLGAPHKVIGHMIADDYGVELDEETIARILNAESSPACTGS